MPQVAVLHFGQSKHHRQLMAAEETTAAAAAAAVLWLWVYVKGLTVLNIHNRWIIKKIEVNEKN